MSFSFPSNSHPASETFDAAHFAEVATRRGELKSLAELKACAIDGATAVLSYCILANDDIALVRVGVRGGKRIVWNFGGGI